MSEKEREKTAKLKIYKMSHSSFKIIANDEPISHNLVILVNKNGSIGTDTATLQNLLSKSREHHLIILMTLKPSPF